MRTSIDLSALPKVSFAGSTHDERRLEKRRDLDDAPKISLPYIDDVSRGIEKREKRNAVSKQPQIEATENGTVDHRNDHQGTSNLLTPELKSATIDPRNTILGVSGDFEQELMAALGLGEDKSDPFSGIGLGDLGGFNSGGDNGAVSKPSQHEGVKDDGSSDNVRYERSAQSTQKRTELQPQKQVKVPEAKDNAIIARNYGSDLNDDDENAATAMKLAETARVKPTMSDVRVNLLVNGESVDSFDAGSNGVQQGEEMKRPLINGDAGKSDVEEGSRAKVESKPSQNRFYDGLVQEEQRGRRRRRRQRRSSSLDSCASSRTPSPIMSAFFPERPNTNKPLPPVAESGRLITTTKTAPKEREGQQKRQSPPANRNHVKFAAMKHPNIVDSQQWPRYGRVPHQDKPYPSFSAGGHAAAPPSLMNALSTAESVSRESFDGMGTAGASFAIVGSGSAGIHSQTPSLHSQLQDTEAPVLPLPPPSPSASQRNRSRSPISRFQKMRTGTPQHRSPLAVVATGAEDSDDSDREGRPGGGKVLQKLSVRSALFFFFFFEL